MEVSLMRILLIVAALLAVCAGQAEGESAEITGDAERGFEQYVAFGCYSCHGYSGQTGQTGVLLAPPRFPQDVFSSYVRNPPKISDYVFAMPAYVGADVTDQVLADIYAYLKSRPGTSPPLEDIELLKDN